MVHTRPLYLLSFVVLLATVGTGLAARLDDQRATFLRAEQALERGSLQEFERLRKGLRDYPLYPYLEYQALSGRLAKASNAEVGGFLKTYRNTPLADMLRADWLQQLAEHKRWSDYLRFYEPSQNTTRRCQRLHALIATGKPEQAMPEVAEIWLHGKSQPSACDPVFDTWTKAGHRTKDLVWQRIEKAMEAGEWRLAEYLGRDLSNADQVWLKRWVRLHRTPALAGETERYDAAHPYREAMLSHAVRRLARWDGMQALQLWQNIKPRYPFSRAQIRRTENYIVRNLVRVPDDTAYAFIRSVDVGPEDLKAQEARIRAALLREDWPQVLRWIAELPDQERGEEHWTYWQARALAGSGDETSAKALYAKLARERSYYGFLAADRLGAEYHLSHAETPASDELVRQIAAMDGVERARELVALKRWTDARREWREATRGLDGAQLKAAAKLAKQRGWHDQAIFTLAKTGYWDDLELRFPLEHAALVEQNARQNDIDIAWVFAVMRQESAFMDDARSHAGAMGLMQLMPATARNVARDVLKRKPPRSRELFKPEVNIALGSAYLSQVKGQLGNSAVLATAAYNAGPHRVTRWLPARTLPADIWIELVPFSETRSYLQRVLAYTVIYEKRMGKTPTRLNQRLHPVPPDLSLLGGIQADASTPAGSAG